MGTRHAAVIGAGIGGLAAGVALQRVGWEVTIYEAAEEIQSLGAGISIWPNGVRALRALGLGGIADQGITTGGALRRADGSVLVQSSAEKIVSRFGAPLVGLHRAELHAGLLEAAGADRIRWGKRLTSCEHGELEFADGDVASADVVVGADGIDSRVRQQLVDDGIPLDSGLIGYRGVARFDEDVPVGGWWGPGSAGGLLNLPQGKVYWYVTTRDEPTARPLREILHDYGYQFQEIAELTPAGNVLMHRLYDRDPVKGWSRPTATLLGDAAHPMLPFLGQGACSALEDAVCLGHALDPRGPVHRGLTYYESIRWKPTADLIVRSRRAGNLIMSRSAVRRRLRNAVVGSLPDQLWLWRLNAQSPPTVEAPLLP